MHGWYAQHTLYILIITCAQGVASIFRPTREEVYPQGGGEVAVDLSTQGDDVDPWDEVGEGCQHAPHDWGWPLDGCHLIVEVWVFNLCGDAQWTAVPGCGGGAASVREGGACVVCVSEAML